MAMPAETDQMQDGDMLWSKDVIVMKTRNKYIAVVQGAPTVLAGTSSALGQTIENAERTVWA